MKNVHKLWRCVIANIMYIRAPEETKRLINADMCRYSSERTEKSTLRMLDTILLSGEKSFRSIFYYRFRNRKPACNLCRIFLPDARALEIGGEIGGGLMISHFHSVVCPKKAGQNLRVGSGVVIDKEGEAPTFGDNVYVASNATVVGDVNIGSNVIIGAGSVVTEDLPGNGVYVGNPARLIKHIGDDEALLNEIM